MRYLILLLLPFLIGCKAKQIDWTQECSNRFPPTVIYKKGDTKTITDTIIEPGLIIQADPILLKVKCPPSKTIYTTKTTVDTIEIEGIGTKAKISLLEKENKEAKDLIHSSQNQTLAALKIVDEEVSKKRKANNQRNILAIGMVLLIGWNCRKLLSKLISPFL